MKRALITGITGMDGSYLAELLLAKSYEVWGCQRPSSSINTGRIDHIYDRLKMRYCDLTDEASVRAVVREAQPDEIYNLAAQSHVRISFDMPRYTFDVNERGVNILLRAHALEAYTVLNRKFYQASSSEMFGNASEPIQNEMTFFDPCSPYGETKVNAYRATESARYGHFGATQIFAVNGILFNHTSERQKETFITRKITKAAARIKLGLQDKLFLGNLDAKRDIGYAPDYVEAIWLMMQQPEPDDYVIATGESRTIREILDEAFGYLGLEWQKFVAIDERLYRPTELHSLCGDASKAKRVLGWEPKTGFKEIVRKMVNADLIAASRDAKYRSMLAESLASLNAPMKYDLKMYPRGLDYVVDTGEWRT